ncbi:MAG: TetR/AcrR family transcriptional regulator [Planctomycetota bacterium]
MTTQDTKDRILDAAEKLFADQGFAATSLRAITTAAGVNLAAVNYHFGSKRALLAAVFERRLSPINEQRLELLDAVEASNDDGPLALEAVLGAFVGPALRMRKEWGEAGAHFIRFIGRAHSDTNPEVRAAFLQLFRRVFERFLAAFRRALPDVPAGEIPLYLLFVVGAMAHTMAWSDTMGRPSEGWGTPPDVETIIDRLVSFAAAGMRADAPARARGGVG